MKNPNKTRRYKMISGEKTRRVFRENLLVGFGGVGIWWMVGGINSNYFSITTYCYAIVYRFK